MRIERNIHGYTRVPPGIGYFVFDAPTVGEVEKGAIWLFTWNGQERSEDSLQLIDVSEHQAHAFSSDASYDAFLEARKVCLTFDWSQTGARMPPRIINRVALMFRQARESGEF
jgi:hypothetical protein